jgi:TonB family protein
VKWLVLTSFLVLSTVAYCADAMCVRHLVAPGYPHLARMASLQGSVTVDFEIAPDGRVISASGSGAAHKLLISTSEENIRQWTSGPLQPPGTSSTKHTITYIYKLEGKELYYDPPPTVVLDLPDRVEITTHPPELETAATNTLR